ncbi:transporter substrate-binding domain-containing protein [Pseudoalteromonas sp. T1lg24]|uniref:transporter substrate-binding domain-containing protein n=1 Tax=Pseudoalteromonas sp. T1lg24 TaxID=2077099 RepID=UPI000CF60D7E|nr:transporter substrate-binding domain-containing protein [Pseudoalteromonas sp. T1lg24]
MTTFLSRFAMVFLLTVFTYNATAQTGSNIKCGMATGYPPFQFIENNQPTGFDYDVLTRVLQQVNQELYLVADTWDEVVNHLRFAELDCVTGMEINPLREKYFDFTIPYYFRYTTVFVKEDSKDIEIVRDLYGKKISGDKHSLTETIWQEKHIKDNFRLIQTESKEQAMLMLANGETTAAIMPRSVGLYLAKQYGVKVKIVQSNYRGTPVAIAVRKGNKVLLDKLNSALQTLLSSGQLDTLQSNYQD